MKKVLLAIALVLSLLLTLASCDGITDVLGSILGVDKVEDHTQNIDQGDVKNPDDEEDESDTEKTNDPEANISSIVSAVNKGMDLGSLIDTDASETVNYAEIVKQLREYIKDVTFSNDVSITANSNGEAATIYGYMGAKDGVVYTSLTGSSDTYVFVEDDFKIVTVQVDEDGSCYADVENGLYEYIELLLNMGQGEIELDEETQKMMQFLEKVVEIKLPQASKKDITYDEENGRYYFTDNYTEKAVHEVARKILEDYYEVYPEETPEDIYEGLEEGIAETLEILNLKIWINAHNEGIIGFGFSVDVLGEDLDESDEIGHISGIFDFVSGSATFKAVVEGTEDYEAICTVDAIVSYTENSLQASGEIKLEAEGEAVYINGSCKMNQTGLDAEFYAKVSSESESSNVEMNLKALITTDTEGLLRTANFKCDFVGAYDGGVYDYDDYGNAIYVTLHGNQTASVDFSVDLTNIENGGKLATLYMQTTAGDFEAYIDQYDQYGYCGQEYSEKYTQKYAGMKEDMYVGFELISSNGGEKITARAETRQESINQEENANISMDVIVEASGNADFGIPTNVQKARQEALDSYVQEYTNKGEY